MKEFSFKINGQEYKTTVEEKEGGKAEVTVNGKKYDVELPANAKKATTAAPKAAAAAAPAAKAAASGSGMQVKSPLPGSIIKVLVSVGQ